VWLVLCLIPVSVSIYAVALHFQFHVPQLKIMLVFFSRAARAEVCWQSCWGQARSPGSGAARLFSLQDWGGSFRLGSV